MRLAPSSSSCVRSRRLLTVLASACMALAVTVAHADPLYCQRGINSGTARFAQARMKAMQKCWDGVVNGRAGTCPDGKASAKITKAGFKLQRVIGKACGGGDVNCGTGNDDDSLASIGWDVGTCPNIASGAAMRSSTAATSPIASSAAPLPRWIRPSRFPTSS